MNLFRLKHRLLHALKAGNRHSVHSPFVYRLTDEVLRHTRTSALEAAIRRHFPDFGIVEKYPDAPDAHTLVLVRDPYRSPEAKAEWDALKARSEVRISIDVFGLGLLFFLPEVKEKQHFVLKTK